MVFKFNSPQHFLSYVEELHNLGPTGTQNSSNDNDFAFALSRNLEDAYNVIRETTFDTKDTDVLQAKISELKKGTMYSDEGFELEIPEYLAGSDKVWLKPKHKRTPTRIIDDVLIIDAAYNASRSAETSRMLGMKILKGIYKRRVIPRKIVVVYGGESIRNGIRDGYLVAIDVSFSDLNGIAKLLHPSMFRRIYFRMIEIYPDLSYGYGRALMGDRAKTQKGYISIDNIYHYASDDKIIEDHLDIFLGIKNSK